MSDEKPWHRQALPPLNTPALAIVVGYLGLISFLCIPAPFALLLGILALRQLQRGHNPYGWGRAIFGIVMGAIFSLAYLILAVALLTDKVSMFAPP
jgi:hypothetical protein